MPMSICSRLVPDPLPALRVMAAESAEATSPRAVSTRAQDPGIHRGRNATVTHHDNSTTQLVAMIQGVTQLASGFRPLPRTRPVHRALGLQRVHRKIAAESCVFFAAVAAQTILGCAAGTRPRSPRTSHATVATPCESIPRLVESHHERAQIDPEVHATDHLRSVDCANP